MADTTFLTKKSDGAGNLILDIGTLGSDTHVLMGHNLSPVEIAVTTTVTATLNRWHRCTGTSADYTVTLPACASNAGKLIGFIMDAALTKLVTLDGNSAETIDGATTRIMWANESCILRVNDAGTAWEKIGGKSIPMASCLGMSGNQTFAAGAATLLTFNTSVYNYAPAAFQDATTAKFIIQRSGRYIISVLSLVSSNNASASSNNFDIYKGGVLALLGFSYSPAATNIGVNYSLSLDLVATNYLQPYGVYGAGSFTTTWLVNDSATHTYNLFSMAEVPTW